MEFQAVARQLIPSIREGLHRAEFNRSQCRRLLVRIDAIVLRIRILESDDVAKLYSCLVTPLKRARSLILECGGPKWVERIFIRANNKEAFEELHNELSKFVQTYIGFTSTAERSTDLDVATLSRPTPSLLNEDAARDFQEILENLRSILQGPKGSKLDHPSEHLDWIIKVVSDRYLAIDYVDSCASYLQISGSEIVRRRLIGTGSYGDVYEATWLGCRTCLKDFPWSGGYSDEWLKQAMPLLKLRHPNVLQLVGLSPSGNGSAEKSKVLTEILQGDMRSLIDRRMKGRTGEAGSPFNSDVALDIMKQVARGLSCLHQNGFMHADRVLTTNIIIKEDDQYVDARIGDFGVPVNCPVEYIHVSEPRLGDSKAAETARWMAPEVCAGSARFTTNSDIYSFGVMCYELLTGRIPFDHYTEIVAEVHSRIVGGERPELPENLDEELLRLIQECWDVDPSSRPTAPEIVYRLEKIQFCAIPTASASVVR